MKFLQKWRGGYIRDSAEKAKPVSIRWEDLEKSWMQHEWESRNEKDKELIRAIMEAVNVDLELGWIRGQLEQNNVKVNEFECELNTYNEQIINVNDISLKSNGLKRATLKKRRGSSMNSATSEDALQAQLDTIKSKQDNTKFALRVIKKEIWVIQERFWILVDPLGATKAELQKLFRETQKQIEELVRSLIKTSPDDPLLSTINQLDNEFQTGSDAMKSKCRLIGRSAMTGSCHIKNKSWDWLLTPPHGIYFHNELNGYM